MNTFTKVLIIFLLFVNAVYFYSNTVHKKRSASKVETELPADMQRLALLSEGTAGGPQASPPVDTVTPLYTELPGETETPEDKPAGREPESEQQSAVESEQTGNEIGDDESLTPAELIMQPESGDVIQACYTIGPLATVEKARAHNKVLVKEGYKAEVRSSEENIQRGYWVMLPPFLSRDSANKALGNLRRGGIKDVALIVSGEFENSISVGLYTVRETALNRQKELLAKNYKTLVRERHVSRTNYWLDVTGPQQQLARRLEALSKSGGTPGIATCRSGKITGRE